MVHRVFKELLAQAEVKLVRFHDLRHTCASPLLAQGAYPKDVQEILGHSNTHMTMNVYAHAIEESKRNAADMTDSLLACRKPTVAQASGV
jgi:integrase